MAQDIQAEYELCIDTCTEMSDGNFRRQAEQKIKNDFADKLKSCASKEEEVKLLQQKISKLESELQTEQKIKNEFADKLKSSDSKEVEVKSLQQQLSKVKSELQTEQKIKNEFADKLKSSDSKEAEVKLLQQKISKLESELQTEQKIKNEFADKLKSCVSKEVEVKLLQQQLSKVKSNSQAENSNNECTTKIYNHEQVSNKLTNFFPAYLNLQSAPSNPTSKGMVSIEKYNDLVRKVNAHNIPYNDQLLEANKLVDLLNDLRDKQRSKVGQPKPLDQTKGIYGHLDSWGNYLKSNHKDGFTKFLTLENRLEEPSEIINDFKTESLKISEEPSSFSKISILGKVIVGAKTLTHVYKLYNDYYDLPNIKAFAVDMLYIAAFSQPQLFAVIPIVNLALDLGIDVYKGEIKFDSAIQKISSAALVTATSYVNAAGVGVVETINKAALAYEVYNLCNEVSILLGNTEEIEISLV